MSGWTVVAFPSSEWVLYFGIIWNGYPLKTKAFRRGSERVVFVSHLQNEGQDYPTNRFMHCEIFVGKLVSSVSTVCMCAGILTMWEPFSGKGIFFFSLSRSVQSDCEARTAHTGVRDGPFLGIKRLEREVDHPFASSDKVRNVFMYTSMP